MSVSRRTRMSVIAAAASGALVVAMAGTALAAAPAERVDCAGVDLQDAQAALDAVAPSEQTRLADLCESVLTRIAADTGESDDDAPATTPAAAPDEGSPDEDGAEDDEDEDGADEKSADEDGGGGGDRDCADFDSQAGAQAALEEDPDDPERLDADDDGVACEDRFGTENQQVAVHPEGGVATGGAARP